MNKYEKLSILGEGTLGIVLKCRHIESGEEVAIKKFKEVDEEGDYGRKICVREVKLLRALNHENIVRMREAFRRKGLLYIVFDLAETTVMDILEENPRGVGADATRVMTFQVARALEHCHRLNVIHRDVKPENLLLSRADYALKLCDFGCARQLKPNVELTDYGATRWYRPPELLLSTTNYGKGVDLWSLGCIIAELTDGCPLFAGKSDIDQLSLIRKALGPLTPVQMERCLELSDFQDFEKEHENVAASRSLEKRFQAKMAEAQYQLFRDLISMDPAKRPSARACVRSPWLKGTALPSSLVSSGDGTVPTSKRPKRGSSPAAVAAEGPASSPEPGRGASRGRDGSYLSAPVSAVHTESQWSSSEPAHGFDHSVSASPASTAVPGDAALPPRADSRGQVAGGSEASAEGNPYMLPWEVGNGSQAPAFGSSQGGSTLKVLGRASSKAKEPTASAAMGASVAKIRLSQRQCRWDGA